MDGYIETFYELADAMANGSSVASVEMPDYTQHPIALYPQDFADHPLLFHKFGDVLTDVNTTAVYRKGQTATAVFVAGNPRNNVMQDKTYLTVERLVSGAQNGTWTVLRTDNDWDTRFGWQYTSKVLGMSKATIEWDIDDTIEGTLFLVKGDHC